MSNRVYLAAAGGLGLLAAATFAANTIAAPASATMSSGEVGCEIAAVRDGVGIELRGLARAQRTLIVGYKLTIKAGGSGGSSDVVQSGEARLAPGEKSVLGIANLGGVGDYTATLRLTWPGGEASCQRSGSA